MTNSTKENLHIVLNAVIIGVALKGKDKMVTSVEVRDVLTELKHSDTMQEVLHYLSELITYKFVSFFDAKNSQRYFRATTLGLNTWAQDKLKERGE